MPASRCLVILGTVFVLIELYAVLCHYTYGGVT